MRISLIFPDISRHLYERSSNASISNQFTSFLGVQGFCVPAFKLFPEVVERSYIIATPCQSIQNFVMKGQKWTSKYFCVIKNLSHFIFRDSINTFLRTLNLHLEKDFDNSNKILFTNIFAMNSHIVYPWLSSFVSFHQI